MHGNILREYLNILRKPSIPKPITEYFLKLFRVLSTDKVEILNSGMFLFFIMAVILIGDVTCLQDRFNLSCGLWR